MFRVFIFQIISANEFIKKIYEASSFNNWIINLKYYAKYKENIKIYNIRKKAFIKVNNKLLRIKHR